MTNEAFARAKIDALLADAGWKVTDGTSVRFEHVLQKGLRADYVLCDRHGRGRRRMSLQNKTNWLWLTKNPGKKEKDEYRPIKESVVSTTSK